MIRFKINIPDALTRAGYNSYVAKETSIMNYDVIRKLQRDYSNISLKSLNTICALLDLQPKDLIEYVPDDADKAVLQKFDDFKKTSKKR